MQITIHQAEIEKAIKEYVGRQLTVANGVTMKIELKATRGDTGMQATIDIQAAPEPEPDKEPQKRHVVPTTQEPKAHTEKSTTPPAPPPRTQPFLVHREERVQEPAPAFEGYPEADPAAPVAEVAEEQAPFETGLVEVVSTAAEETPAAKPEAPVTEVAVDAPKTGKRTLFGGLKKPTN